VVRLAEVGRRSRDAARRWHRRHDPDLALDFPRRGGGQGRLGDPQGAEAARARPGADRLPDLRAAPVRHGHRRRGGRAPARGLRRSDRGVDPRLRRERHRRGAPRRLRDHRRQGHGHDLLEGGAAEEGSHRAPRGRAVRGDRPLLRCRAQDRRARRAEGGRGARLAGRERGRHALTPERIAMLEAAAANDAAEAAPALEESESPVAGRRFSRA
jgi:hypothetical protein